jgi:hypothetical protein
MNNAKLSESDSQFRAVLTAEEILTYKKVVGRLARGKICQQIPNEHPMHAAALIETMFDNAEKDVRIFTGKLAKATYDQPDLVAAAARFLERPGARLRILVQRQLTRADLQDRAMIAKIHESPKLEIRQATGSYAESDANHFAVMDEHGFRFELEHSKSEAVANFNEPRIARELIAAFDSAFAMGKPLI